MQDWENQVRNLHKEWDSPDLWPRIAETLEAERGRSRRTLVPWQWAAAALFIAGIGVSIAWYIQVMTTRPEPVTYSATPPKLLTEKALGDLKAAEAAYLESIDKLAQLAEPAIEMPPTPLIAAYRERLALLDAAITELREQAESNPLNANVQTQLAALYRDKQETLREVVEHAEKN